MSRGGMVRNLIPSRPRCLATKNQLRAPLEKVASSPARNGGALVPSTKAVCRELLRLGADALVFPQSLKNYRFELMLREVFTPNSPASGLRSILSSCACFLCASGPLFACLGESMRRRPTERPSCVFVAICRGRIMTYRFNGPSMRGSSWTSSHNWLISPRGLLKGPPIERTEHKYMI